MMLKGVGLEAGRRDEKPRAWLMTLGCPGVVWPRDVGKKGGIKGGGRGTEKGMKEQKEGKNGRGRRGRKRTNEKKIEKERKVT